MSFDQENKAKILENLLLINSLMEMKSSKHKQIRKYVVGTLWELKDKTSRSHMKHMAMNNKKKEKKKSANGVEERNLHGI